MIARPVADLYRDFMRLLQSAGSTQGSGRCPLRYPTQSLSTRTGRVRPTIATRPGRSGTPCWQSSECLVEFRPGFIGKCYAVHSFWGSFDLAVTRFSGNRCAGATRCRPHHARSLFPRGEQRWLLARQRQHPVRRSTRMRPPSQRDFARRRLGRKRPGTIPTRRVHPYV